MAGTPELSANCGMSSHHRRQTFNPTRRSTRIGTATSPSPAYGFALELLQESANPCASDCDVLTVPGCDVRLVVYTVAAGSADAEKLDVLRVTNGAGADGSSPRGLRIDES